MALSTIKVSPETKQKLKEYAAKKNLKMYEVADSAILYLVIPKKKK
jgi:predicted transcriptional regulator